MSSTATPVASHNALPAGSRLDEFEIRSVIGEGGFGIVYHAFDHALERDVAIKEYMPSALAARNATLQVSVLSQGQAETFALGLRSFVNEARLLARFEHPALVKVHRFWEGHGTAYMVMPLYRGRTLKALRQALSASPSETWLRALLEPLLGVLELLHDEGVYHRDIAPDNILVADDGKPVLLDFGAARRVISGQSQALTAILKPNFAPIERYAETEGLRQGPWTDLYALGATLHFVITGSPPRPATARAFGTEAHFLASVPRRGISVAFLQTVDWMMTPRPEQRPQSVAALRMALAAGPVDLLALDEPAPPPARDEAWQHTVAQEGVEAPPQHAVRPSLLDVVPARDPTPESDAHKLRDRRHRRTLPVGAALLLATASAVAYLVLTHDEPTALSALAPVGRTAPAATASTPAAASSATVIAPTPAAAAESAAEPAVVAVQEAEASAVDASAASDKAVPAESETPRPASAPHARPKHTTKPATLAMPPPRVAAADADPVPAAASVTAALSPSEQCRGRLLLAWYRCVKRACNASPAFNDAHECVRVRRIETENARDRVQ